MQAIGMKIAIDSDDAGIELKKTIFQHLQAEGYEIEDLDFLTLHKDSCYPEIGYHLAVRVKNGAFDRGILICGTGIGMAIIANKVEGVYAGVCHDVFSAERLKKSNDAQVLTMGARVIGSKLAKMVVDAWLESEFQGGGSSPKVERLRALEKSSFHQVVSMVQDNIPPQLVQR